MCTEDMDGNNHCQILRDYPSIHVGVRKQIQKAQINITGLLVDLIVFFLFCDTVRVSNGGMINK
jgi:hypothetical protein